MYPGIKQEKNEFSSNYFEKSFIDKIVAAKAKLVNKSKDDLKELEEIGKEQFKAICIEDSDNDASVEINMNHVFPETMFFGKKVQF